MRIKEVCALTGLTERTVRYYEQEKLISPKTTESNGRIYRDYSAGDASGLKTVAGLRRAGLSIEEIRTMKRDPKKIAPVMSGYTARLSSETESRSALLKALSGVDFSRVRSVAALAALLSESTAGLSLPKSDAEPDFSRFEPDPPENKEQAFELYRRRQERRYRTGRFIVLAIAVINVLLVVISQFIAGFNIFTLVVQLILSVCLIMGVTWVRWLFAVGSALSVVRLLVIILSAPAGELNAAVLAVGGAMLLFNAASAVLLFAHKGVSEFLYSQKNG